jgi:hypothetical protein
MILAVWPGCSKERHSIKTVTNSLCSDQFESTAERAGESNAQAVVALKTHWAHGGESAKMRKNA